MANYAHPEMLVETQWVASHLEDDMIRIIEVDVDTSQYDQGHVPGAIGFNWQTQLNDQVRRDVISQADLEALLSKSGVSNDHMIVLYGDNNNWFAAFALWILKMYGHRDLKLMNGGRKKWLDEGRPVTKDPPTHRPATYRANPADLSLRALRDDVFKVYQDSTYVLVDVRSPQEFTGEVLAPPGLSETAQRGGHIPGARNIPWAQAVRDDGTFRPADELQRLYEGKGVTPDKDVVAYCRIGERSSHTWFVLKYLLGYRHVRNYDGSWTEWGSMVNAPIQKGA